ncbi:MAG: GIY-YIG nuclease family protein [Elusimicrobia bacterium]|nr:GIY-YIG nuclease family protein [Elusimicrobiota bacterium]
MSQAKLNSFYVIPGYTFFYWGFTVPQREAPEFMRYFRLRKGPQTKSITLLIHGKRYPAKIRLVNITTKRFPNRSVVQIYYEREYTTLKALRKLLIYSYASTINKGKPLLKELIELVPKRGNAFIVKVISRQKTDFDHMLSLMEDKNLFAYWKSVRQGVPENFFIDFARHWIPVAELRNYENRINVIYLLCNSERKQLYVGKANQLGNRVQVGQGRVGLARDWDKFMFFEIHPKYAPFIEQIESFVIRAYAALMENEVGVRPLRERNIRLVNRRLND